MFATIIDLNTKFNYMKRQVFRVYVGRGIDSDSDLYEDHIDVHLESLIGAMSEAKEQGATYVEITPCVFEGDVTDICFKPFKNVLESDECFEIRKKSLEEKVKVSDRLREIGERKLYVELKKKFGKVMGC